MLFLYSYEKPFMNTVRCKMGRHDAIGKSFGHICSSFSNHPIFTNHTSGIFVLRGLPLHFMLIAIAYQVSGLPLPR